MTYNNENYEVLPADILRQTFIQQYLEYLQKTNPKYSRGNLRNVYRGSKSQNNILFVYKVNS